MVARLGLPLPGWARGQFDAGQPFSRLGPREREGCVQVALTRRLSGSQRCRSQVVHRVAASSLQAFLFALPFVTDVGQVLQKLFPVYSTAECSFHLQESVQLLVE